MLGILHTIILCLQAISVSGEFTGEPPTEIEKLSAINGYATEKYEVETDDGYLLDIFRMIPKRNINNVKQPMYPVFLLHGLACTAENFMLMGNESLAFLLTDAGYDVWLGNARGTWHSRKHKILDPDRDEAYWMFTWHEIGFYDVPSMIDHILRVTGKQQLSYVGHSQGSTSFLVMCSERPEYNKKIKLHIALAPASFFNNNVHPVLNLLGPYYEILKDIPSRFGIYELEAIFRLRILYTLTKLFCVNNNLERRKICKDVYVSVTDAYGNDIMDDSWLPLITDTMPAGLCLYQILHYFQIYKTGSFEQFDWGREINLQKYKSEKPPSYNLSKISAPVVVYYGMNDALVNYRDVENLIALLPNVLQSDRIADDRWAHMNFLFARNIIPLSYKWIMESLRKYA